MEPHLYEQERYAKEVMATTYTAPTNTAPPTSYQTPCGTRQFDCECCQVGQANANIASCAYTVPTRAHSILSPRDNAPNDQRGLHYRMAVKTEAGLAELVEFIGRNSA